MSKVVYLLGLVMSVAFSAAAQPAFKVYPSEEKMIEGGTASLLSIDTDHARFSLRVPMDYGAQVHASDQSITFTTPTGSGVITVRMTTNYAGKLPALNELRDVVVKKYPAASFAQATPCFTACGPGCRYEFFQPSAGNTTVRISDAYVSFAEGSFEFTLKCDSRDYDACKLSFGWLLNSFRLQADTVNKQP